jgi:hypothetical protein
MQNPRGQVVRPYGRLKLVGVGVALAVVGGLRMAKGVQIVTHWTGQPLFSWGLIATGALCVLLAAIPALWVVRASAPPVKTGTHRR